MTAQPQGKAPMAELCSACPRRVLIVRLDAIGDYILFRNVLRFIRYSSAYRNAYLTVLGNPAWRSLAETFDNDCADEWLWVEQRGNLFRKSMENLVPRSIWHRRVAQTQAAFRKQLLQRRFDEVLSLQPIRDPLLDELVAGLAPSVIGLRGPGGMDSAYTRLLEPGQNPFVFLRNRCAAANLTGEPCEVPLVMDIPRRVPSEPKLMLFPGASHWTKRWPLGRFAAAGRHFLSRGHGTVCVAGGPADVARIHALACRIGAPERVFVWNGNRSLAAFAAEMASCSAVVTNDTMALHLAAAVGTPAVGIVNGVSGRDAFWPYPSSLGKRVVICEADGPAMTAELRSACPICLLTRQIAQGHNLFAIHPEEVCHALESLGVLVE